MSIKQPLYSAPKLIFTILNKKKSSLEQFEPFSIEIENIYANDKQLARFSNEFGEPDDIPTFAFVTAFKASLQCLSQSKSPSSIIGLIHLSSEFQIDGKLNWLAPLTIKATVDKCEKTEKGLKYNLVTEFYQQKKRLITNTNVMLDKSKKYRSNSTSHRSSSNSTEHDLVSIANWPVNIKTAWRYAKTSGDFNPIHLHPLLARQLGLPNMLIHGMYNASKALSELKANKVKFGERFLIEFNRPCFIPSFVQLKQYKDTHEYGLFSEDGKDRFLKLTTELNSAV